MFFIASKFPNRKDVIVFESFLGKQYSDNPRAIYEYLIEHEYKYTMYWSMDKNSIKKFQGQNIVCLRRFSIKWIIIMSRAGYWVSNSRLPLWIPKPRRTKYVQTWHGTPLKRLALDMEEVYMPGTSKEKYKKNFISETRKWDYLISPNSYSTNVFRRAFNYNKEILESGYPRNDYLANSTNQDFIRHLKKKCKLPIDKKVILYAPTWRDDQYYEIGKYKFTLKLEIDKLMAELGDDYVIALRLHYLVADDIDLSGYESFVYNFSSHQDIRDLYLISDILITDYSSVFFDYANLKRPMIFYVYDVDNYRDNLRGFYFDIELEAPGPLVKTTDEVVLEVKKIEHGSFVPCKSTLEFYNKFCYLEDGNATERVVKSIFND